MFVGYYVELIGSVDCTGRPVTDFSLDHLPGLNTHVLSLRLFTIDSGNENMYVVTQGDAGKATNYLLVCQTHGFCLN
jgi:hypothetical protein